MIERRKKIVLYSPQLADERNGVPSGKDVLPLSVLTVAGWPIADGYEVELIDGNLYSQAQAHARALEACEGALVFGTTGILGYQVADGFLCTTKVRERFPKLATIIGGWFASCAPELQLRTGLYDAVCLGQGEITFRDFVRAVDSGSSLEQIPGLALLSDGPDGGIHYTAHRQVVGWDQLLNCPWQLIDFEEYRTRQLDQRGGGRLAERLPRPPGVPAPKPYVGMAYFASFGCPEPCTFCCSPGVTGQRWKAMPAERMLDDIEELSERWDFDVLRFHDANWGVSEKRVREFCEGKLARGLRFEYFPMMQAFSLLSYKPRVLDLLAESGAYVVNIGGEAGTDAMMEQIGKHTQGDDNLDAARELDQRGIATWMTYIIGFPGETEESMLGTIDQVRRIRAACSHSHPAVWPYRPIPGTPMYEATLASGYVPPATLLDWGRTADYHLNTWNGRIPRYILKRRQIYQHLATLSHGLARGKVGWWERRAKQRLESGNFRLAAIEPKLFDVYTRATRTLTGSSVGTERAWVSGSGETGEEAEA